MKAITYKQYGVPESVLSVTVLPQPIPKENELLIKIKATAVNDYDWSMVTGKPLLYRLMFGFLKPKHRTPGMELSGIVEGVGAKVNKFKVGDEVFGDISEFGFGTFAEYLCIHENAVIMKPESLSFEDAAAIPHASTLALQGLGDIGKLERGEKILINGGGGGVGTIGLQLAKLYHCEVTGVDNESKLDMMKSIGYDQVVDYKKTDFTQTGEQYDLILDCKTSQSPPSYLRALKPGGRYVTVGGKLTKLIKVLFWGKLLSYTTSKKLHILSLKANKGLDYIADLYVTNKIKNVIDGPHRLEDTPRLVQYFGKGQHKGKVIIRIL